MRGSAALIYRAWHGYLLLLPLAAVILVLGAYPVASTFLLSLTDARLASSTPPQWIGFANYTALLGDRDFRAALIQTALFVTASVTLEVALGLALALFLHQPGGGVRWTRALVLLPWALPTVVSARLWNFLFIDTYGAANDLLVERLGLLPEKISWMTTPGLAMGVIIVADVWKTAPFVALLLLAGLQLIPGSLYEAARVDGANRIQQFLRITLPLLRPALLVALVFRTLDALRVFDLIWVMTRGSAGTDSLGTYIYRTIVEYQRAGAGSAASVVLMLMTGGLVAWYWALLKPAEGEGPA